MSLAYTLLNRQVMRFVMLFAILTPACALLTDDDGPTRCVATGFDEAPPALNLVNPDTLECQTFSVPNCDPACGPCPGIAGPPSWGSCASPCIGLAETDCQTAAGCRIAHGDSVAGIVASPYIGCYPIDMSPAPSVPCGGLDAWNCSRHDDCSAFYSTDTTTNPVSHHFEMCAADFLGD